jgi:ribonuclease HI
MHNGRRQGRSYVVKLSLTFSFPTYNNQAEYESFLAVLRLARQLGAEMVSLSSHYQLIESQINGITNHVKPLMQEYLESVKEELKEFCQVEVIHIPREQNTREDILLKLASTRKT